VVFPEISVGSTTYQSMLNGAVTSFHDSFPFVMSGGVGNIEAGSTVALSLRRRVAKIVVENISQADGLVVEGVQLRQGVDGSCLFSDGHPGVGSSVSYFDSEVVTDRLDFYTFPQPVATSRLEVVVNCSVNGVDFVRQIPVPEVRPNTRYAVKVKLSGVEPPVIEMKVVAQVVEDWSEGDDIVDEFSVVATSESGVLINGVRWASVNVGSPGNFVAGPSYAGMLYQWNRRVGWSSSDPLLSSDGGSDWYKTALTGDSWSAENDPCPMGWRVPSAADFLSLCDTDFVTSDTSGSPLQCVFTDIASGKSVSFVAAGFRGNLSGSLSDVGSNGFYWSADGRSVFRFGADSVVPDITGSNNVAYSVRCVAQ
jgi:uncharacterized protein (TIGR02145 family)